MQATEIYKKQNLGNRVGFGARPALLVVDFVNGFNDAEVLGGGNIDVAMPRSSGEPQEAGIPPRQKRPSSFSARASWGEDRRAPYRFVGGPSLDGNRLGPRRRIHLVARG